MRNVRTKLVFGEETYHKLQNAKILLLGVGGVGSFCLDCLYRSGVRDITIIDFDRYDLSNQNRQMHSEMHEGQLKVEALKSHYPEVIAIAEKITPDWVEAFDFEPALAPKLSMAITVSANRYHSNPRAASIATFFVLGLIMESM